MGSNTFILLTTWLAEMNTFCTLLSFWSLRRFLEQKVHTQAFKIHTVMYKSNYSDNTISMAICIRHLSLGYIPIALEMRDMHDMNSWRAGQESQLCQKVLEMPIHTHTHTHMQPTIEIVILPRSSDPVHFWQDSLLCFCSCSCWVELITKEENPPKIEIITWPILWLALARSIMATVGEDKGWTFDAFDSGTLRKL